jgi:hypothetical protein
MAGYSSCPTDAIGITRCEEAVATLLRFDYDDYDDSLASWILVTHADQFCDACLRDWAAYILGDEVDTMPRAEILAALAGLLGLGD